MRSCCVCFITSLIVLVIAVASAIAITAALTGLSKNWYNDEQRPKLFAIVNMMGVMAKRIVEYPQHWSGAMPVKTRCACRPNSNTASDGSNYCLPDDPCNPDRVK